MSIFFTCFKSSFTSWSEKIGVIALHSNIFCTMRVVFEVVRVNIYVDALNSSYPLSVILMKVLYNISARIMMHRHNLHTTKENVIGKPHTTAIKGQVIK